jgi:hypothetical protein
MGKMGQANRRMIVTALFFMLGLMSIYLFSNNLFGTNEAVLIILSSFCICACVRKHIGERQPENVVIVAASAIFFLAYIAQSMLFLTSSRASTTSLGEAISVRSVFSVAALSAGKADILLSLQIVLVGFVGVCLASIFVLQWNKKRVVPGSTARGLMIVSNPVTIAYIAIVITIFFGFLRKIFGLESPTAPALPMGLGGLINIVSSYVGPNLSMAAFFFALHQHDDKKAGSLAIVVFALAIYNYALFTSKLSLVLPMLYLLATQYLLKRRVVRTRTLVILGAAFVVIYPFLNLYRSALALGVKPGELIQTIANLYTSQQDSSELNHGVVQVALSAILGRVVGYDPLLILLQANPYPDSLLGYILTGDLDKYLTYEILDFQDPMGYSPGFLGRLFYVSRSFFFVLLLTTVTVLLIAYLVRKFWRGGIRLKFMAPLLLGYCLSFFSDGIRFELFRALVVSTAIIYVILRLASRTRVIPMLENT